MSDKLKKLWLSLIGIFDSGDPQFAKKHDPKPIKVIRALAGTNLCLPCAKCGWTIRFQFDGGTRLVHECQGCGEKWFLTINNLPENSLVPPWATPTEKGVFCIGCKAVYPDLESYEKHLIPAEGRCDGGKSEPSEAQYGSYD